MGVQLRTKELSKGKKSYYLDIYHDGQRHYEFLKIYSKPHDPNNKENKLLAEQIRAKREIELNSSEYGFVPKHRSKTDFVKYWERHIEGYLKRDTRMYVCSLAKFKAFIENEHKSETIKASNLTESLCSQFKDYLTDRSGLTGETPADYFARFKRVLKQAVKDGLLKTNPAAEISISRTSDRLKKEVLIADELRILKDTHCGGADVKRAFLFACNTGCGYAELKRLKWKEVRNGRLKTLRAKLDKKNIAIDIPLNKTALKLLGKSGKPDELVFKIKSDTAVNNALKTWVKRSGIDKHITFYCARHTFAVLLLTEGNTNLKAVQDALAHTTLKHTVKYLNHVDHLKDEAVNSLPEL